ncbi:flagellar hook protein FlgE [Pelagibacterium halotolerans]|uniref:Flagellar hook protein FlgE n=1 Tax=Pelagibacterium halotolerans (strain DSM 22347 / JCM 15775 / CGMCC 1.7692 / B2) TaxID=1082931 RepID=G4RES2_PELHB|nr:flagellar hook-basal body complex protein [Pelagibacterium halotolerans]AEQ51893.1 flagellar hook protein FlgE [Pelagibacterium halotolerans B2]QJR18303.1 flagellar hook-basal body complex protein [Pelagibacterium halotolerans]SEA26286.1 flagellar hook protein FlgE [Pelagibacterium halotolerans]
MGIYGALSTAVTGMAAQSFALENISGNIANSQTTGYKRMETGFIDLIPDAAVGRQKPGAVLAYSRSTNDVRGDIITSSTGTHVALNGSGFFVVAEKTGTTDGTSVFGDANYYTRRGDFEMDREGYLRNGAGYYLKGVPIDATTGNVAGSVPQMVQVSNGLIPAKATQRIDYEVNLPDTPAVGLAADFATTLSDDGDLDGTETLQGAAPGFGWAASDQFTISVGGGAVETFEEGVDGTTLQDLVDWVNSSVAGASASLDSEGRLQIVADDTNHDIAIGGTGTIAGIVSQPAPDAPETNNDFVARSVEGGAITVYAPNGASVNVQMRWGKVSNEPDTWRLYYMSNSEPQTWAEVPDGEFTFEDGVLQTQGGSSVSLSEPLRLELPNLTINGTVVGDVELDLGAGGLTQFDNANGRAAVSTLNQNGYPAGSFMSVAINDNGRVVATYSNGEQIEIFQLVTANFNAENQMKRLDGGIYSATAASGEAILSTDGGITGGALESSNTDISEEFTKLIVTQQAYSAGTRIVSTSDEMLQEALNMIR